MEAFGIIGMAFGMMGMAMGTFGYIQATSALSKIAELEKQLNADSTRDLNPRGCLSDVVTMRLTGTIRAVQLVADGPRAEATRR